MRKTALLFLSLLFLLVGCTTFQSQAQNQTEQEKELTPSDKNYTGPMTKSNFNQGYTQEWFSAGYESYEPSEEAISQIKKNINNYNIKVFMGTWCPDSRRETPKLFKLLDEVGFKEKNLTVYAVDRSKSTEENFEKDLNINYVPTIIFFNKKGEEVNRIVEYPRETLEEDILKIVTNQPYKNVYED